MLYAKKYLGTRRVVSYRKCYLFVALVIVILLGQKKKKRVVTSGHDTKYLKFEIIFHPKF